MAADLKLVRTLRKMLQRLVRAERLRKDDKEDTYNEVMAAAAALPREGILEALDLAVGSDPSRRSASVNLLSQWTDVEEVLNRIGASLLDPDPAW
jgi:hypothetical protein